MTTWIGLKKVLKRSKQYKNSTHRLTTKFEENLASDFFIIFTPIYTHWSALFDKDIVIAAVLFSSSFFLNENFCPMETISFYDIVGQQIHCFWSYDRTISNVGIQMLLLHSVRYLPSIIRLKCDSNKRAEWLSMWYKNK